MQRMLKWRCWARLMIVAMAVVVTGCSTTSAIKDTPQTLTVQGKVSKELAYPIDVYDPWEGFNRRMYNFNAKFDRYLFLPVVNAYETVTPDFVETGVTNFFSNIGDISNFVNSALQLKLRSTGVALSRFVINSTVGILGLFDPASGLGIHEREEDFGQTLGRYGVNAGPYLVLPVFGPSSLRDTGGLVADAAIFNSIDPLDFDDHSDREIAYYLLNAIDSRHQVKFRYLSGGTPFEYETIRYLYLKKRELDVGR